VARSTKSKIPRDPNKAAGRAVKTATGQLPMDPSALRSRVTLNFTPRDGNVVKSQGEPAVSDEENPGPAAPGRVRGHQVGTTTSTLRNVAAEHVQADEIHSFICAKTPPPDAGDCYTWVAIDTDTKLVISYLTGGRGMEEGRMFMRDLKSRLSSRMQLTTDEYSVYAPAVKEAFGGNVDFEFGDAANSFVERQNLTTGRTSSGSCGGRTRTRRRSRTTWPRSTCTTSGTTRCGSTRRSAARRRWKPGSPSIFTAWSGWRRWLRITTDA